jgi:hypothetical protein
MNVMCVRGIEVRPTLPRFDRRRQGCTRPECCPKKGEQSGYQCPHRVAERIMSVLQISRERGAMGFSRSTTIGRATAPPTVKDIFSFLSE